MKCRVCGEPACISLKAYNTALCASDFISFLENRTYKTIKKYHLIEEGEKPIVAVSGGKDSLSIWSMLNKLGYPADAVYIHLGIGEYSDASLSKIIKMADMLKSKVYTFNVRSILGKGIYDLSRFMKRVPCSACGTIKRYAMNRICMDKGYTTLVTGHNIDDEASALFGNILYWKDEYLGKKNPFLEGREGHLSKKVKPFFLCSEREIAAYAVLNNIDYIHDECPFSVGAKTLIYKGILNKLEESSPGTKLQFIKGYLKNFAVQKRVESEIVDSFCTKCGYPTYGDLCNFCRVSERLNIEIDIRFDEFNASMLDSGKRLMT